VARIVVVGVPEIELFSINSTHGYARGLPSSTTSPNFIPFILKSLGVSTTNPEPVRPRRSAIRDTTLVWRVETRRSDIPGLKLPIWENAVGREWSRDHLVIDTAGKTVPSCAAELEFAIAKAIR
jgi:hypothetical protein